MATEAKLSLIPKKAFFEVSVRDPRSGTVSKIGRVEFDLFKNTPITSANFGQHCQKTYSGVSFHRVIPGFMCQFGDVEYARVDLESGKLTPSGRPAGTGGYGLTVDGRKVVKFPDENFVNPHAIGRLSMANSGPGTNGSQIFICTSPCDFLDRKHVVFGQVANEESMKVMKKVESYGSRDGDTSATVFVSESGVTEYWPVADFEVSVPSTGYLDIAIDGKALGRINVKLFKNTPLTSQNFAGLCNGFTIKDTKYTYTNTFMHRIIPQFMLQMGDVTEAKIDPETNKPIKGPNGRAGTGGVTAHAVTTGKAKFADENFINKHGIGKLSMANSGANTNGSQIFICTAPCDHLNGKHVVFGEVADQDSMKIVKEIEKCGSRDGTPSALVTITGSGAGDNVTAYSCPEEAIPK